MFAKITRNAISPVIGYLSIKWPTYSKLVLAHDRVWTNYWDYIELKNIFQKFGLKVYGNIVETGVVKQSVFYLSRWTFFKKLETSSNNRLATAYYHGLPGTGIKEFDILYTKLSRAHHKISRIQVTHSEMRNIILESGISDEKVHQIPIGINMDNFCFNSKEKKHAIRKKLGLPQSAFIVGSFHKDGIGWGDGKEPKLIKGPDILVNTVGMLKQKIPELYVMLTGPARGYVKDGLSRLNIPFKHFYIKNSKDICRYYHALDIYIIPSRQEGGPKAVLEAMASGVPLVSTKVGQAMDLIDHGNNGWIVDVNDVERLAHHTKFVYDNRSNLTNVIINAINTAEENSYLSQIPLWKKFMIGFIDN